MRILSLVRENTAVSSYEEAFEDRRRGAPDVNRAVADGNRTSVDGSRTCVRPARTLLHPARSWADSHRNALDRDWTSSVTRCSVSSPAPSSAGSNRDAADGAWTSPYGSRTFCGRRRTSWRPPPTSLRPTRSAAGRKRVASDTEGTTGCSWRASVLPHRSLVCPVRAFFGAMRTFSSRSASCPSSPRTSADPRSAGSQGESSTSCRGRSVTRRTRSDSSPRCAVFDSPRSSTMKSRKIQRARAPASSRSRGDRRSKGPLKEVTPRGRACGLQAPRGIS